MNKKLIWISVSVIAVIALLVGLKKAGVIGKEEGTEVTTEKVALRTITESVNASGKIYPEIEVKVSPDISGEIVNLFVEEGDSVKKGQLLAKIYADIYSSQRDQVTASVNQVKAQYENVKANLSGLKTVYENAKATNERYKKLFADKIVSRSEYEQTEQAYRSAESNYNGAKESIKSGEAQIQGVRAQLARAEKDLARTSILAPMDGIVSSMGVKKGERVVGTAQMAGTEMMRVADMKSIEVRVDVGENDITKVKIGDTALVEVDAYNNRKFKGIVYKIANPVSTEPTTNPIPIDTPNMHAEPVSNIMPSESNPVQPETVSQTVPNEPVTNPLPQQIQEPAPTESAPSKPTEPTIKKISFATAKKEIDDFVAQMDNVITDIKDKYGINIPETSYEDLLPDELKIKLIEDFFNDSAIQEMARKAN